MEIDFSPSQVPPARGSAFKGAPAAFGDSQPLSLDGAVELQRKLNDLALTRPDKVDAAVRLLSDVKYPPEELLNGIAHLLAIHLDQ